MLGYNAEVILQLCNVFEHLNCVAVAGFVGFVCFGPLLIYYSLYSNQHTSPILINRLTKRIK